MTRKKAAKDSPEMERYGAAADVVLVTANLEAALELEKVSSLLGRTFDSRERSEAEATSLRHDLSVIREASALIRKRSRRRPCACVLRGVQRFAPTIPSTR